MVQNYVYKVDVDTYHNMYSSFDELKSLDSEEDIVTFLSTFEKAEIDACTIVKVLTFEGKYIFVVDSSSKRYDFFEELNKLIKSDVHIVSTNAKMLYQGVEPRGYFSAGYNTSVEEQESVSDREDYISTGDINAQSDESSTGFIDEEDMLELNKLNKQEPQRVLYHVRRNVRLPINDSHGILIGRSSNQSEYPISGNSNISRSHARVYKQGSKYMVHDCNSANGTFIDGLRVKSDIDRELLVGSTLRLADEEFKLE